jgi:hypothetical protein
MENKYSGQLVTISSTFYCFHGSDDITLPYRPELFLILDFELADLKLGQSSTKTVFRDLFPWPDLFCSDDRMITISEIYLNC